MSLKQIRWPVVETGGKKKISGFFDEQDRSHAFLLTRLTLLYFYFLLHPSLLHHWWSHVLCVYHQEGEGDRGRESESCFSLISSATTGRHTHTFTHKHSETYAQPVCSSLRDGHRKHSNTRLCGHRSSEQHHRYREACDIYSTVSTWVANSHLQVNSLRSFVFCLYPQIWARMQRACFVFED